MRVSRLVPTKKTGHSTLRSMIGDGHLDLSVKFQLFWKILLLFKFQMQGRNGNSTCVRDLGIYLGDGDDMKRGFLIRNTSTGAVQVRLDLHSLPTRCRSLNTMQRL